MEWKMVFKWLTKRFIYYELIGEVIFKISVVLAEKFKNNLKFYHI